MQHKEEPSFSAELFFLLPPKSPAEEGKNARQSQKKGTADSWCQTRLCKFLVWEYVKQAAKSTIQTYIRQRLALKGLVILPNYFYLPDGRHNQEGDLVSSPPPNTDRTIKQSHPNGTRSVHSALSCCQRVP